MLSFNLTNKIVVVKWKTHDDKLKKEEEYYEY